MGIPMLKIRRPVGRLIFNMGIAIPSKTVFLIETAPCYQLMPQYTIPCLADWGFQSSRYGMEPPVSEKWRKVHWQLPGVHGYVRWGCTHTNCHWTHPRLQHTWLIHHKQWHPDHTLWGHPRHFRSQCRACREPPTTTQAKNTQTKHPNMAKGKLGWYSLPHITGMGTTHRKWHFWQASRPSMAVVQRHTGWGY